MILTLILLLQNETIVWTPHIRHMAFRPPPRLLPFWGAFLFFSLLYIRLAGIKVSQWRSSLATQGSFQVAHSGSQRLSFEAPDCQRFFAHFGFNVDGGGAACCDMVHHGATVDVVHRGCFDLPGHS
jgi:hypothetical protein